MRASSRAFLLLTFLTLLGAATPAETPSLRLTVYPVFALDDGVRIEAFIPRNPDNRKMRLEVDGPLNRAFEEDLDGDKARVLFPLNIDRLPEGHYEVLLTVVRLHVDERGKETRTDDHKRAEFCRGGSCIEEMP